MNLAKFAIFLFFICILSDLSECMNEHRQGEEPSERKVKRLKRINEEIAEFKRDEEFYKEEVRKTKEKYEKACQNLNKTRKAIEDLEKIAKQVTGHDGKDQDLQMQDVQIIENTNSNVEINYVSPGSHNYQGQSLFDTPLNSKEGPSSASQVVPPTATHPRIIGQHHRPAYHHQTLGPPPGFRVHPAALRPGINVQTRPQGLSSSDTPLNTEEGPSSASRGAVIQESEKDLILKCFERGLTADQAKKEIDQLKGTKWTSLSTIKRSYKKFWSEGLIPKSEICAVLFHCFKHGLTINEARKEIEKLNSTKRTSLTTIKYFYNNFESIEKNKIPGNLLAAEEGTLSASQADKSTNVLEGENEAQVVEATGSDFS